MTRVGTVQGGLGCARCPASAWRPSWQVRCHARTAGPAPHSAGNQAQHAQHAQHTAHLDVAQHGGGHAAVQALDAVVAQDLHRAVPAALVRLQALRGRRWGGDGGGVVAVVEGQA